MKILVTGATGYIGGAAAKALRLAGHEVSGLARSESSAAKLVRAGLAPVMGGFGAARAARIETEKDVLGATGVRGVVMRPGLVYGAGGSYDLPQLIAAARKTGAAPHLGPGATLQGYVHIDELADLYRLVVERAPKGVVMHGVVAEGSQRDLAAAVSRLIGVGDNTASLS